MTRAEYRASLRGRPCVVGMDLSSTRDLTALVGAFPDDDCCDVLAEFFIPSDNLRHRSHRDRVPYDQWQKDGFIQSTPGNVVDYEYIRNTLRIWASEFDIREIAFDPWNATDLVQRLQDQDGFLCTPIRQGFGSLSAPTKELEKLVLSRALRHDGHPVLRWNLSNVAVETDAAGNLKPSKRHSREKIDGVVALVMALARAGQVAGPRPDQFQMLFLGAQP